MSFQRIAHRSWVGATALALCAALSAHAADAPEAVTPPLPQAVAPAAVPAASAPQAATPATGEATAAPASAAPAITAPATAAPATTPSAEPAAAPATAAPAATAAVPQGPAISIDFTPLPNRTVYAQYKNDVAMALRVEAAGESADAPKTTVKKADVSMAIAIGTRQAVGGRAKDGSMNVVGTTESFSMKVEPEEIAKMMEDDIAELNDLVGSRTISRVNADGAYELIRVEPAKGKGKISDRSLKQAEVDQWITQIPQGKHTLHVGEVLTMKVNYPAQGGVMPASLDMELLFTLRKIEGQVATFDITPKMQFGGDNPMLKGMQSTGDGVLIFDTKQHLVKDLKLTLKLESNAEMGPGMFVHTKIDAVASGAESLKPFAQPAAGKKAKKKA